MTAFTIEKSQPNLERIMDNSSMFGDLTASDTGTLRPSDLFSLTSKYWINHCRLFEDISRSLELR